MVISKTPFRVSLFGGGTDYPLWYKNNDGAVISFTINKYCYILARKFPPFFESKYRFRYYDREEPLSINEIKHPSIRETIKFLKIRDGIEIVHYGDLPARSGLGSSSSFTVGLVNALSTLNGRYSSKKYLADSALHIEQKLIKESVGSQDQIAAAYGGFNLIKFNKNSTYDVIPMGLNHAKISKLVNNMFLVYTGNARDASVIAAEKIRSIPEKNIELNKIKDICSEAQEIINKKNYKYEEIGYLLGEHWKFKKKLASTVTNPLIDELYEKIIKLGAIGGKLLGAGSGGFLLFVAPKQKHIKIKESIGSKIFIPIKQEYSGSHIIHSTEND